MVWRGSPNSELDSNVFVGNFASGNYGEGICKLGFFFLDQDQGDNVNVVKSNVIL